MIKTLFISALVLLVSCNVPMPDKEKKKKEEEAPRMISQIDGEEYINDMSSELNAKKSTRLLEESKDNAMKMTVPEILIIIDSLNCSEEEWRGRHFNALNTIYHVLQAEDYARIEKEIFTSFLTHPLETTYRLESLEFNDMEFWNKRLAAGLKSITADGEITTVSVINLMLGNCSNCTPEDEELIVNYVGFLEKN